ncbi:CxC2 domain-containing protein [Mycena kentingensis (nom. inval.)]|nr:CxC2 domain-containing protein [Mycena kentingensis (nom. inval.)]
MVVFSFPKMPPFVGPIAPHSHLAILYDEHDVPKYITLPFDTLSSVDSIPHVGANPVKCSQCPKMSVFTERGLFFLIQGCDHVRSPPGRSVNTSIRSIMPPEMEALLRPRRGNLILIKLVPSRTESAIQEVLHRPLADLVPADAEDGHINTLAYVSRPKLSTHTHDDLECSSGLLRQADDEFIQLANSKVFDWIDSKAGVLALALELLPPPLGHDQRTCATLACLNDFHALSLHGKTTAYDYYRALEYRTSGAGIKPLDRYKAFMRMARQYRHLLLLKRRGRGHTAKPIVATRSGELAIWCAACPHPGINLPDNWMDASPWDQCLYIQFIAMDACFRLKRRLIGSDIRIWDSARAGLTWSNGNHTGNISPALAWPPSITQTQNLREAIAQPALEPVSVLDTSLCSRTGVGDLQRGERYANMDYILASLLRHIHAALRKMFSSDIACQWGKDLKNRLLSLPPLMHINAHIWLCRVLFHLSLIPGSGATDGEGIERLWAAMQGLAGSTKLSGHGARADQLDDHWTFWNWSKLLGLAKLLRRRLQNAKVELCKQEDSFRVFSAQQAEHVPEWLQMVKEFEEDGEKPNPYASSEPEGMSEAAVRKLLEEEDREEMQKGRAALHAVTPSEFIVLGLELEDEQRRVRVQAELKKRESGAGNTIRLKPLRKKLTKTIKQLRDLQATYSPTSLTRLSSLKLADDIHAEDIPLLLPSSLSKSERAGCHAGLVSIERRLRDAQCKRALVQLRHQLHIKARLLIYKKHQSRNQGMNTRSRALVARNEVKIKSHADMYQAARAALCAVEDGVVWPPLLASDIRWQRGLQRQVELVEAGLLAAEDVGVTDDEAKEEEGGRSICVQVEEVLRGGKTDYFLDLEHGGDERNREFAPGQFRILQEEIRRLPLSLRHEEHLWDQRAAVAEERGGDAPIREGRKAYARKQAAVYRELIW